MFSTRHLVFAMALFALPAQAQQNVWFQPDNMPAHALICPVATPGAAFCLSLFCEGTTGVLGIIHDGGTALGGDATLRMRVDDRFEFLIPLQDASGPGQARYGAPLYAGEGARMLDALTSGSTAILTVPTQAGVITQPVSLQGSARVLRSALQSCPNRDLQLDPSDAPVVTAPKPNASSADAIDAAFVVGDCVATESEIYAAIEAHLGPGNARIALPIWANAPDFRDNYAVISRDPFTYRWISGPCAG